MAESWRSGVNREADQFVRRFHTILILLQRNELSKKEVIKHLIYKYSYEFYKFDGFERLPKHFQAYSLTMDDDLSRFDSMYNPDNITFEKTQLGFKLMAEEIYERNVKGRSITYFLENCNKRKFVVYCPNDDDDNINYENYSYPRAVIHTARPLSNLMLQEKLMSISGQNLGWHCIVNNKTRLIRFFDALNTNNDALQGFDDVKENPSIMHLVAIPKVAPHTYLNLSKAEALIFIIFNIINDIEINLKLRIKNEKAPLKTNYTTYTISKLHDLAITFTNLDSYSNAIKYAIKFCLVHERSFAKSNTNRFKDMVKTELIRDMLNPYTYTRITDSDIEKLKENVNIEDINQFIRLFYRIALKRIKRQGDPKSEIMKENENKAYKFSSKTTSYDIKRIPIDERGIFLFSTVDYNDLGRFDFMYSSDNVSSDLEKVEVGLQLMERKKTFKDFKGNKTFETSSKRSITVFFPMSNDISYTKYFYSRAVIHTARPLSNLMLQRKMMSALGLSIGWEGMTNEANLNTFFYMLNMYSNLYIDKKNLSIMYLVTIPKITPHKYLNLSKAEAFIFIIFNIICDSVTNFKLHMSNPNTPLKNFTAKFTDETISKVNKLERFPDSLYFNFKSLDFYSHIIDYAANVCITDIMHKERSKTIKNATKD